MESPAAANHYLCDVKRNVGLAEGDDRYDYLCARYEEAHGVMDEKSLGSAIATVSHPEHEDGYLGTAWTMLMDLTNPSVIYWSRRHFDKPFRFTLGKD